MVKFTKMHGLGNDYIYVDETELNKEQEADISSLAKKLSDRHFGIGGDGIVIIGNSDVADFKMSMYNQDGSQAEMCGNGIRCVGKFVYDKGMIDKTDIKIETLAGIKQLKLFAGKDNKIESATVDMGAPILEPNKIPVISNEKVVKNLKLKAADREFVFTCVSMGNPHAVTFVDDLDNFNIEKYGKILEVDKVFPHKSNIEFAQVINRNTVKMRVWERGAGETLACGTGASATCVACTLNGFVNEKEDITIKLRGGDLKIKWDGNVFMTGPAVTVYEGEIFEK